MSTTLKEQAWQSGLVLSDDTPEWNQNDWPPLDGGWREYLATVVLDHLDEELHNNNNNNNKGQTVVVSGGYNHNIDTTKSVRVLNLAEPNKQWQEGPPMNKKRYGHAAVVCNGGVYVMGGYDDGSSDSIERINANDLLKSCLTTTITHEMNWTTLNCRLSTGRWGCCAVAVRNRYIVVMGGFSNRCLSSVEIFDTNNHIVTAGPSMTLPRSFCASAVVGHRIFIVGGENEDDFLNSVEYLDFAEERKDDTLSTVISFLSTWITHSELVLPKARSCCSVVAVGSCLVVAVGWRTSTVEVLDTHFNRVWNLPGLQEQRWGCRMVAVANQVAVIGGCENRTCATLPLMDKNTWCFRLLCEQPPNGWHQFREGMGIRDSDISHFSTSTLGRHSRVDPTQWSK